MQTALLAIALLVLLLRRVFFKNKRQLPLPPGPPKRLVFGNLFDFPPTKQWETFRHWSRKYKSDILHLSVAEKSIIILSSARAINDLLEKKSSIYSDRPRMPMINELMGWSEHSLGPDFLRPVNSSSYRLIRRKIVQRAFSKTALPSYRSDFHRTTEKLLRDILCDPAEFMSHFKHMSGTFIMSVVYGIDVQSTADPYIHANEAAVNGLKVAGQTGKYIVDTFPAFKYIPNWVPGAGFKREARRWKEMSRIAVDAPFTEARRRLAEGISRPCLVSRAFDELGVDPFTIDHSEAAGIASDAAGSIYTAAVDTTISSLGTFVLAMLANPDAQRTAQAELDRLLKFERLPTLEDEPSLPYIGALVKEVLRWKTVTPLAIPHCVSEEDQYRGYRIPKGSTILGNVWAICHDEATYSEPDVFKPERFLGTIPEPEPDVAFGFGRRACPGKYLASATLFLSIARILTVFEITRRKTVNKAGEIVQEELSYEYSDGLAAMPLPFKCTFTPRSSRLVALIAADS
ncbi:cytochrome P450 [Mycena amicta]|nr:cytochrome P450 [Mycena amicta]